MSFTANRLVRHCGGCHCGAVRYEVMAPATITVLECNCSVCRKKQIRSFTVPCSRFKLISGHDSLTTYTFNTHQAKHNFCKICGVQSFYIPRSNPDGIGVIHHCLDEGTVQKVIIQTFDGKNWEESMKKNPSIKAMSKDNSKSTSDIMY